MTVTLLWLDILSTNERIVRIWPMKATNGRFLTNNIVDIDVGQWPGTRCIYQYLTEWGCLCCFMADIKYFWTAFMGSDDKVFLVLYWEINPTKQGRMFRVICEEWKKPRRTFAQSWIIFNRFKWKGVLKSSSLTTIIAAMGLDSELQGYNMTIGWH